MHDDLCRKLEIIFNHSVKGAKCRRAEFLEEVWYVHVRLYTMCVVMLYIMCLVLGSHEEAVDDGRKPVVATRMGMYIHNRLMFQGGGVGMI